MSRNTKTSSGDKLVALPKDVFAIRSVYETPTTNSNETADLIIDSNSTSASTITTHPGYAYYNLKEIKELVQTLKNVIRKSYL